VGQKNPKSPPLAELYTDACVSSSSGGNNSLNLHFSADRDISKSFHMNACTVRLQTTRLSRLAPSRESRQYMQPKTGCNDMCPNNVGNKHNNVAK